MSDEMREGITTRGHVRESEDDTEGHSMTRGPVTRARVRGPEEGYRTRGE